MAGRNTKLTAAVQRKIVRLLKSGTTIVDACDYAGIHVDTFYEWIKRGKADETPFSEFSDAVTRAQSHARIKAVGAIHTALSPLLSKSTTTEIYTETRINKVTGKEYEYTEKRTREALMTAPPDWRAAVEYLKRRDPAHWSEKLHVEFNIAPELLKRLTDAAKEADVPLAQLFEEMVNALGAEVTADSADSNESS